MNEICGIMKDGGCNVEGNAENLTIADALF